MYLGARIEGADGTIDWIADGSCAQHGNGGFVDIERRPIRKHEAQSSVFLPDDDQSSRCQRRRCDGHRFLLGFVFRLGAGVLLSGDAIDLLVQDSIGYQTLLGMVILIVRCPDDGIAIHFDSILFQEVVEVGSSGLVSSFSR